MRFVVGVKEYKDYLVEAPDAEAAFQIVSDQMYTGELDSKKPLGVIVQVEIPEKISDFSDYSPEQRTSVPINA